MSTDKFALLALRLIDDKGTDITLRKVNRTAADPNKPWEGNASGPNDVVLPGVYGYQLMAEGGAGGQVRGGEEVVYVAAEETAETLEHYDYVIFEGRTRKIESVKLFRSGSVRVVYQIKAAG